MENPTEDASFSIKPVTKRAQRILRAVYNCKHVICLLYYFLLHSATRLQPVVFPQSPLHFTLQTALICCEEPESIQGLSRFLVLYSYVVVVVHYVGSHFESLAIT